jgi:hypothetical protein
VHNLFKNEAALFIIIAIIVLSSISYMLAKRGKKLALRRLKAVDFLDECVGRAAEMGGKIHVTTGGYGSLYSEYAPQILAGISAMNYVVSKAAALDVPIIVTTCQPEVYSLCDALVSSIYKVKGKPENYKPEMVRFLSGSQFAYSSAVLGILHREKVVSNIIIGMFAAESLLIGWAGKLIGALQIGGTANTSQLPFFAVTCDELLIGEDIYALSAFLSGDVLQQSGIASEDLVKLALIAIIIVGSILKSLGVI